MSKADLLAFNRNAPQQGLLVDPSKTLFSYSGYVKTGDFQIEYQDMEEHGQDAKLGNTCVFKIDKNGSMLGKLDLIVQFDKADDLPSSSSEVGSVAWVEALGYAMIEKAELYIGSNYLVETITGDQMYILNELAREPDKKLLTYMGYTGRSVCEAVVDDGTNTAAGMTQTYYENNPRIIRKDGKAPTVSYGSDGKAKGMKLMIPLDFFFTKNASHYLPLSVIANANDIEVRIKFRPVEELITKYAPFDNTTTGVVTSVSSIASDIANPLWNSSKHPAFDAKLRCEYVLLPPEEEAHHRAKEHVRLNKEWQENATLGTYQLQVPCGVDGYSEKFSIELNLYHQISELVFVIRKVSDIGSTTQINGVSVIDADQGALTRNRFAFHGRGRRDPNPESAKNRIKHYKGKETGAAWAGDDVFVEVENIDLKLNNQSRHPTLPDNKLDMDYLYERVLPRLYSSTSGGFEQTSDTSQSNATSLDHNDDMHALKTLRERKNIFVLPFSILPESTNPAGHLNMDKVTKAQLQFDLRGFDARAGASDKKHGFTLDVWGLTYNWLKLTDGRFERVFH